MTASNNLQIPRLVGVDLVLIGEIAPIIGVSSSALYQAGCHGEIALHRVGDKWACDLAEVQVFAAEKLATEKKAAAKIAAKRTLPPAA